MMFGMSIVALKASGLAYYCAEVTAIIINFSIKPLRELDSCMLALSDDIDGSLGTAPPAAPKQIVEYSRFKTARFHFSSDRAFLIGQVKAIPSR